MTNQAQTTHHTLRQWIVAVRPWSFPASAMPVIVTIAFLLWKGMDINWLLAVIALADIILFHASGNTWSDYFDYRQGVDADDTYGVRILIEKIFTPREILILSISLLVVAATGGIYLLISSGLTLLWIGLGGVACTLLYPYLKFRALGDVVIGMAYAVLPTIGTSYVAVGFIDWQVLLLAIPVGMITVAILHANNTRDIITDRRAAISTFAMRIGHDASLRLYAFWILAPLACIIIYVVCGVLPVWSLLTLLAIPVVIGNVKTALSCLGSDDITSIANLDERSAKLQLLFSLILTISLIIATIL